MKEKTYATIIFATLMGLLVGFSVIIAVDTYTDKKRKKIFAAILALTFVLIVQNYASYYLTWYAREIAWRTLVSVIGYSVRPALFALFAFVFLPTKKHIFAWVLVAVNAIMHTTAFYSGLVFCIKPPNNFSGGPLRYLCLIVCFILLTYLAVEAFLSYREKKLDIKEVFFHGFWMAIIIIGIVADILWGYDTIWISYVTIAAVIACVYSYIWLHQRFVADYETAVLAEQRYNTMISQLQPHFIYNSLSAIADMDGVPETAQNAILDFSKYLRENLDAMTSRELVSFDKELSHIEKYTALEKLRFGDKVNVVFNIEYTDFSLPALSVQMLVENAIKHGITQKYEGGTVTISTKKQGSQIIISVVDDGVGFDVNDEISHEHIGLNNIRKRLEYPVNGILKIESERGKGTTATIIIPDAH